ncbi:hypothetical protein MNBD_ALPHA07-1681 [hydrothermal vent metagenome]|uniref:EamA domain-containing protein n=1 Tax=hydrothermal vent metagenome TaxID=652676 RepID=A0A3B0RFB7_9ZZZZ
MTARRLSPALMAVIAAVLWGLWWMPIRTLESLGLSGAWGSFMMNAGAAGAAALGMVLLRISPRIAIKTALGAALVGVAVSTYSIALTHGDVVRIVLLFYLAPAWSKIIEWAFMGQGWGWASSFTLLASLAGAYLVLGGQISLAAFNLGDTLALLSGVAWSSGAALIFTGGRANPVALSFITALSAMVIGLGFIRAGQGQAFSTGGIWVGAGFGVIYVLPILALTLWSAQRLSPAVITFLLTAEILSGVITAALFLDEPFGLMQAGGAGLIVVAAMAEVLKSFRVSSP